MAYQRGIFPGFSRRPDFMVVARSACRAVARAVSPEPQHEAFPCKITVPRHLNHAFGQVIEGVPSGLRAWITRDIITAYQLHELGYAHSIEVWDGGALVGGMYGVAQGRCFVVSRCSPARLTPRKQRCWSSARICPARRTPDRLSGAQ
jgi:leucyl/phenylalanyl-tRNA--protein transferase